MIKTLTKADIAGQLSSDMSISKREAKKLIETFFQQISGALEDGKFVKLSGFGNFQLRDKNTRPGRNPKTGEAVSIDARRVVTFTTGQKLRGRLNGRDAR